MTLHIVVVAAVAAVDVPFATVTVDVSSVTSARSGNMLRTSAASSLELELASDLQAASPPTPAQVTTGPGQSHTQQVSQSTQDHRLQVTAPSAAAMDSSASMV
jgi:hypothetical protein